MGTVITASPEEAAEFIRRGRTAAFPTETVYGLGADIFNEKAVAKIFEAKGRPADNPLIAHVARLEEIDRLAEEITANARQLIDNFFPGPLTVVVKRSAAVPLIATAGLDTIGIRMPRSEIAQRFLSACETPVAAPSANTSGRPSATTWHAVLEDLDGRIDCILQDDATEIGLESTVVDCSGAVPVILRPGAISRESIVAVLSNVTDYSASAGDIARSPGLRHHHYAPKARVSMWKNESRAEDPASAAFIGISQPDYDFAHVKLCSSVEEYAHAIYEFFRECDRLGFKTIYCEKVAEAGIGSALMDRVRRASDAL